ncbi:MAG: hypothetical protein V9E94_00140 [Microthrixaceae bacterium]
MVDRWWAEAEEHGVLPLDERTIELFGARFRDRSPHRPDRRYTYFPPVSPLPAQVAPALGGRNWDLVATVERDVGEDGVLYATGTENSGFSLFVLGDDLLFDYNCFGDHHVVRSEVSVPVGASALGVSLRRTGDRATGAGGTATVTIDGVAHGQVELPFVMHVMSSIGASIGYDHGSQVSPMYSGPSPFRGRLERVDVQLVARPDPADEAADDTGVARARQRQADSAQ